MVVVVLLDVEVDGAVGLVGIAVVHDLLDKLLLLDDVARSMRFDAGRQAVEFVHGLVEAVGIVLGHLHGFQFLQPGLLGNLVLALVGIVLQMAYVGDVAHVAHLVAQMLQIAEEEVERDGRTGMAQMGIAVDRGAADVHAHSPLVERAEEFLLTRKCVVNK